jgi:hypothetical protein
VAARLAARERAPTTSLSLRLPVMLVTLTSCLPLLRLCCCPDCASCASCASCPLLLLRRADPPDEPPRASWLSKAIGVQVTVPAVGVAGSLLPAEVLALPGRAALAGGSACHSSSGCTARERARTAASRLAGGCLAPRAEPQGALLPGGAPGAGAP